MRIGAISDLHVDINKHHFSNFTTEFIEYVNGKDIDLLLIPGDLAGMNSEIKKFMVETKDLEVNYKLFVPGNHCLWSNTQLNSWELFLKVLPELCRLTDWHYLPRNPIKIANTAFIGSPGWYDYSTRNRKYDYLISETDYEKKGYDGRVWNDVNFVKFNKSDKEVSKMFLDQLESDYFSIFGENLQPNFDKLVVVTHVVPYSDMVLHKGRLNWDYFSAFIGNAALGEWLDEMVTDLSGIDIYSIFGHTHFPEKRKRKNGVYAHCVPFGYPHEYNSDNLHQVLNDRFSIIDI